MEPASLQPAAVTLRCGNKSAVVPLASVLSLADVRDLVEEHFELAQGYSVFEAEDAVLTSQGLKGLQMANQSCELVVKRDSEAPLQQETISYTPHPNALTESGKSHFNRISDAIAELVDNSIQATMKNDDVRHIKIQLIDGNSATERFLLVWDNGCGMNRDTVEVFATYYLGRKDVGDVPNPTNDDLGAYNSTSFISKYGVGAKNASFYLGDRLHLITKSRENEKVLEFTIDKSTLDERRSKNEDVFVGTITYRDIGDTHLLSERERSMLPIRETVERERHHEQFTLLIVRLHDEKYERMRSQDATLKISHELAHTYHYFLHPNDFPDVAYSRLAKDPIDPRPGAPLPPRQTHPKPSLIPSNILIEYAVYKPDGTFNFHWLLNNLNTINKRFLDPTLAVHAFRFELKVPHPDAVTEGRVVEAGFTQNDQATGSVRQHFPVIGIVYYYPHRGGKSCRPSRKTLLELLDGTTTMDPTFQTDQARASGSGLHVKEQAGVNVDEEDEETDIDITDNDGTQRRDDDLSYDDAVFDVYWQKRLVPQSTVKRLHFFPVIRSYADAERVGLPEGYLERLKGALFFPWDFPVTNNKLQLQAEPTINDWLNNDAVSKHMLHDRDLKKTFHAWLQACRQQFDQEHRFINRQPSSSSAHAHFAAVMIGDKCFKKGDILKLRFRETVFAKVVEFRTEPLHARQVEYHGQGQLVYVRQPEELFGSELQSVDIGRIDATGSPVNERELAPLIKRLPKSIKLWFDTEDFEAERREFPAGQELTVRAGSKIAWIRVQPRDANTGKKQKAVFHRPGATTRGRAYKARLLVGNELIGTASTIFASNLPENRNSKSDETKYFCFQNITFQNCGTHELKLQILDEDRVLCDRSVSVIVQANEPESFVLRGNFDGEIAILGGYLPSFSVIFLDANENQTVPSESVTVQIQGEGVSVYCEGQSQPMFEFSDGDEDLFFEADQWQVVPTRDGLIGDDARETLDIEFTVSVPGLNCVRTFTTTFQHGVPKLLQVLSPPPGELLRVENGDMLPDIAIGCFDDYGNRAAPLKKGWRVALDAADGVMLTGAREWASVEGTGVAHFSNLIAKAIDDTSIAEEGVNVCQHFLLKLNTLQLSTTLEFLILPDSQPRTMRVCRAGKEVEGVLGVPAGSKLDDLTVTLYDVRGSMVAFPDGASCSVSWARKSFRQDSLPALTVPEQCRGDPYDFTVRIALPNGVELTDDLSIMVEPVEPHQWTLQLAPNATDGIACGDEKDWDAKFLGVVATDRFGNVTRLQDNALSPTFRICWESLPPILSDKLAADNDDGETSKQTTVQLVAEQLDVGTIHAQRFVLPAPFALVGARQLLTLQVSDSESLLESFEAKVPLVAGPPRHVRVVHGEQDESQADGSMMVSYSLHTAVEGLTVQLFDEGHNPTNCPSNVQVKLVGPEGKEVCAPKVVKRKSPIVTFPAFKIKSPLSSKFDFTATCVIEGRVELQSEPIRFQRLRTNKVEAIDIIMPEVEDVDVSTDGSFGTMFLNFNTEDGQPYLPPPSDVRVDLYFAKRGEEKFSKKVLSDYFNPEFQTCGLPGVDRDCLALEQAELPPLAVGLYHVRVTFTESRAEFQHLDKAYLTLKPNKKIEVCVGMLQKLVNIGPRIEASALSNSTNAAARQIGVGVRITAADQRGNLGGLFDPVVCFLRPAAGNTQASDLPQLEGANSDGKLTPEEDSEKGVQLFRRIALQPGVGTSDGDFELVIRTEYDTSLKPIVIPLTFVSDGKRLAQLSEIEERLRPALKRFRQLKHATQKLEVQKNRLHDKLTYSASRSRNFSNLAEDLSGIPLRGLKEELQSLEDQREEMANARSQVPQRTMPRNYPPPAIDGIPRIGVVCELGFGQNEADIRILSFAAKSLIDAVLVERSSEAEQLVQHGVHAWALDQIPAFLVRDKDGRKHRRAAADPQSQYLPLPRFQSQTSGNPQYLVNMIKLLPSREQLRDTVFWNIFRDSVLFDDLRSVTSYRKTLLKNDPGARIPLIYTRDGHVVPSHGAVNPRHRQRSDQVLEFTFGQEPPDSTKEFENVKESIRFLNEFIPELQKFQNQAARLDELRASAVAAQKEANVLHEQRMQLGVMTQLNVSDAEDGDNDDDADEEEEAKEANPVVGRKNAGERDADDDRSSKKRRDSSRQPDQRPPEKARKTDDDRRIRPQTDDDNVDQDRPHRQPHKRHRT